MRVNDKAKRRAIKKIANQMLRNKREERNREITERHREAIYIEHRPLRRQRKMAVAP